MTYENAAPLRAVQILWVGQRGQLKTLDPTRSGELDPWLPYVTN